MKYRVVVKVSLGYDIIIKDNLSLEKAIKLLKECEKEDYNNTYEIKLV